MKNVTPKAGQIWESSNVNKIIDEVTPSRVFYNGDCWESYNGFIIDNIFVPQSDLDWLAVKVESLGPHIKFIARRGSEYLIFESKPKHTPGVYARQQWQNSRYYLGLDEKPQKETKMKAKIQKVELFNIEINGVTHKGFEKMESWKGLACYKNKDGEIIANDFGAITPFDWILFPSDGKAEPQEIIIVSASPCFTVAAPNN